MKKIISLTIVFICLLNTTSFGQLKFLKDIVEEVIEETNIDELNIEEVPFSVEEAANALKEALSKGIEKGVQKVNKEDGYFKNTLIKIPFPKEAEQISTTLAKVPGGKEKCEILINEIGVDAAIDYKNQDIDEQIKFHAKDGIDLFFDNVGGEILDIALDNIRDRARVIICGAISQYSHHDDVDGPSLYLRLAEKYAKMEGFTVMHFKDRYEEAYKELLDLYNQEKLKVPFHVEEGIESFPLALQKLFTGGNTGKLMVKI